VDFYSKWLLVLLVLAPVMWALLRRGGARAPLRFSTLREAKAVHRSWRVHLRWLLKAARIACIVLLVVALARPREGSKFEKRSTKGVALEIVVDRSGSMGREMKYGQDEMTRLEVVKKVLSDFIRGKDELGGRPNDLLGLITFARYADTVCPLVHAHDALLGFLKQTEVVPEQSEENATAIGDAIALAAARLKKAEEQIARRNARLQASLGEEQDEKEVKPDFEIQSKAIILLTDGQQNAGQDSPMEAAQLAKEWGITIYTIGIGGQSYTRGRGLFGDFLIPMGNELDERLLKAIAQQTGGFYGRAGDAESLREIVHKIDEKEKTEIESIEYSRYEERFGPWALAALIALGLEMLMGCTIFRKIP